MMSKFFIDRPVFAWVVALFIVLGGLLSLPQLPISQYPDVAPPSVTVSAMYPGATAQVVADSVTSLIEQELNGAKGLLYYESTSNSYGQSEITLTFQPGTNPDMAQVDVQNRIKAVESRLPQAVLQQGLTVEQASTGFLLFASFTKFDVSPVWGRRCCLLPSARCAFGLILASWWDSTSLLRTWWQPSLRRMLRLLRERLVRCQAPKHRRSLQPWWCTDS
jgi:hypothetical protein